MLHFSTSDGCALLFSFVLTAACSTLQLSQRPRLTGALFLVACGIAAFAVLEDGNRPAFWGHVIPGACSLVIGSVGVGSTGLVAVPSLRVGALLSSVPFIGIISGICRMIAQGFHLFKGVHLAGMSVGLLLIGSASVSAGCTSPQIASRVLKARRFFDPICLWSVALIKFQHEHDVRPFAMLWHRSGSLILACTGAIQLADSLAHGSLPEDAAVCVCFRLLHSFCWMLSGLWTTTMAWWIYLPVGPPEHEGDELAPGLAIALKPRSIPELHNTILAVTMTIAAGLVSAAYLFAAPDRQQHNADQKKMTAAAATGQEDGLPLVQPANVNE